MNYLFFIGYIFTKELFFQTGLSFDELLIKNTQSPDINPPSNFFKFALIIRAGIFVCQSILCTTNIIVFNAWYQD
jgi:hypothetical protein